ncbi:MAG: Gfo/Idh/MocA family oxidoreductase [Thermoguttaceae bacterium]
MMTDSTRDAGFSRRDFLKAGVAAGAVVGAGLGGFKYGYDKALGSPVRVGVIGTGDEGSVLIGAINPNFLQVRSICDIRPYNIHRAFHGDHYSESQLKARPGLMSVYGWKTEAEAKRHVKGVYKGSYEELIRNARQDGIEAVIIALPLHLHAPAAIAALQAGLHVITEKLMGHSVHECKEMARVAHETKLHLATGHQRHYNVLYAQAMDEIQRGTLGELHYIRAQWHRANLPDNDTWKVPLPPGVKPEKASDALKKKLDDAEKQLATASGKELLDLMKRVAQLKAQVADVILHTTKDPETGRILAEALGYEGRKIGDYDRPAIEELIRWRLWDRTGAGLMAELGSHQLDAASIFISAVHGGVKQHPLGVIAAADRPVFPADRDIEDHVFCVIEFPAPGFVANDPIAGRKKIGVQYASINGNGFGGYGEIVYGTKGTLILEREQELSLIRNASGASKLTVSGATAGPTMDTQASGPPPGGATGIRVSAGGGAALDTQASGPARAPTVSRGYAEELEHWAWCIRNPAPENRPRCYPEVALGDAVIALVTNMAAREGRRIEFQESWFDVQSDETPEGVKPDIARYATG